MRCPNCNNVVEASDSESAVQICCPSCGSSFRLVESATTEDFRATRQTIGHFELLDRLGQGHGGSVWRARDTSLDRIIAIKIPHRELLDHEADLFLREARAAAQLNHANIVAVHEVGRDGGTLYIARDYVRGADLKRWLRGQSIHAETAARLVITIAMAAHHAHEAGVVHRDLKPGNILMDEHGQPHLADFGLARRDSGELTVTADGTVLGTPAYMSPEQARGEGHAADRRSDVYSIGVILFEMLTGEIPFRGDKPMLLLQILTEEPPSPRALRHSVPKDLNTITLKCLDKQPRGRYVTARELADDLQRFLRGEPILARPLSRGQRVWRYCRRKPAQAINVALVALLIGSVTVATSLGYWSTRRALVKAEQAAATAQRRMREIQSILADLTQLSEFDLEKYPNLVDERLRLLEIVTEHLDDLLAEHPGDSSLILDLAVSTRALSDLRALDDPNKALELSAYAVELLRSLRQANPESREASVELAVTLHNRSDILFKVAKGDEARESRREAAAIWQELIDRFPNEETYRRNLGLSFLQESSFVRHLGLLDQAIDLALRAEAILDSIDPEITDINETIATNHRNLANWYDDKKEYDIAEAYIRKVLDYEESHPRELSDNVERALQRISTLNTWSLILKHQGNSDESLRVRQDAVTRLRTLHGKWPNSRDVVTGLGLHLSNLAGDLIKRMDYGLAQAAIHECVALRRALVDENSNDYGLLAGLGNALATAALVESRLGNQNEALSLLDESIRLLEEVCRQRPDIDQFRIWRDNARNMLPNDR